MLRLQKRNWKFERFNLMFAIQSIAVLSLIRLFCWNSILDNTTLKKILIWMKKFDWQLQDMGWIRTMNSILYTSDSLFCQICISDLPWKHQQSTRWRLFSSWVKSLYSVHIVLAIVWSKYNRVSTVTFF